MSVCSPKVFAKTLLAWYDVYGRKDLPWRQSITPYRVWISEVMLQQTQVKTVIPYFQAFMARFPELTDLAQADVDELMHYWTGLGYYARARNLHRAAKEMLTRYAGQLPQTLEHLQNLPGIGRSTAGAILSIAFNQPAPILDANVKRVLTRYHALTGNIGDTLWQLAEQYTPTIGADDYAQAMMDLGATICVRARPKCEICPLQKTCQARLHGLQQVLPERKSKPKKPIRHTQLLIFYEQKKQHVLLEKRPSFGIWGGLWSFPECSLETDIKQWCATEFSCVIKKMQKHPPFKHVFTHFELCITPVYITDFSWKPAVRENANLAWHSLNTPALRGFSSPVKKILRQLVETSSLPLTT